VKVTKHGEYLTKLTRFPLVGPLNCYVVREDDGLTLIDSTIASSANDIVAAAQALGQPIVRIAITHAHSDHIGAVDRLRELLPDVEVVAGTREGRALAGDQAYTPEERAISEKGGLARLARPADRLVEQGDRVGSLEVVASPGHTPGHVAYLDTRDQTLIAGDAWVTRGGVAVAGTMKLLMPFPHMFTWHRPTALESARRLRALHPARLAVGHGAVIENPGAAMDRAIVEAERKLRDA
jgi:glyoxylase-like metal-dependent hydrolase (beta-lactamase superfamily II)